MVAYIYKNGKQKSVFLAWANDKQQSTTAVLANVPIYGYIYIYKFSSRINQIFIRATMTFELSHMRLR
jgi:hypothetical protein